MKMEKFSVIYGIFGAIFVLSAAATSGLQTVSDDELMDRMRSNEFLIALFCKLFPDLFQIQFTNIFTFIAKGCPECDKYETELLKVLDEFRNNFPCEVVKVINSALVRLYKPTKEPALVFFRHGVPLLYDGPVIAEEILNHFDQNRGPIVKELTDDTFEHLTQASTGSTTGDWFIQL